MCRIVFMLQDQPGLVVNVEHDKAYKTYDIVSILETGAYLGVNGEQRIVDGINGAIDLPNVSIAFAEQYARPWDDYRTRIGADGITPYVTKTKQTSAKYRIQYALLPKSIRNQIEKGSIPSSNITEAQLLGYMEDKSII